MRLTPPSPAPLPLLPEWSEQTLSQWRVLTQEAERLSRGMGQGRQFDQLVREARELLGAGEYAVVERRAGDRRFVRAVITAWLQDDDLTRVSLNDRSLHALLEAPISRLGTIALTELFLTHFDHLEQLQGGLFSSVRDLLRSAVARQRPMTTGDVVETLRASDALLLEASGPVRLASGLVSTETDITAWFRAHHLSGYADTRWGRRARDAYYLRLIELADAASGDHAFLVAVTQEFLVRQKLDAGHEDGCYFGHQILTALTAKTVRRPSDAWLRAVLDIGGDPRLRQTQRWQTWWSRIDPLHLRRAERWMQGVDLRAFLDGVKQYAERTANEPMKRMLERRKRLLLGLYEQDLIQDVRLVLGSDISSCVTRSATLTPKDAAMLRDGGMQDTAIVYVDCGEFCLIEGSHNFKLHIYLGSPLERLADRRYRTFDAAYLRDTVPALHVELHGEGSHFAVAHQGAEWIRKALDFLRDSGLRLDERGLMTAADYADLNRRRAQALY